MRQVGLRELKNRLSEYVRLVRAGEHMAVTDRGHVVAQLVPPLSSVGRDAATALAELERRGLLRLPSARGRARYPRLRPVARAGTAQHLLAEERAER